MATVCIVHWSATGNLTFSMFFFFQGLIPGKNYSYRVQSGNNISEGFEFTAKRDDEVSYYL